MVADPSPLPPTLLLVVDLIDTDTGLAEVEDDQGRTYAFPAAWLPQAADGQAYRVSVSGQGVQFVAEAGGAARLREKSKQTLLEFSDDFSGEVAPPGEDGQP
ncbi:hypothetical protein GCM10022631_36340 [Deinococcus rubellus]|uniref:DUF3006 domain-containing protein n=1 Tax=Deinococcus rubellus TaxID=1889240 RepID=A0ABY5YJU2_9DEIO|nr:hypothetical protein [Deinococcus rubellus]UWX65385.1 hypothetical protein N0D28_06945 [Deinococcus rubellus]